MMNATSNPKKATELAESPSAIALDQRAPLFEGKTPDEREQLIRRLAAGHEFVLIGQVRTSVIDRLLIKGNWLRAARAKLEPGNGDTDV
ncbi:hypothetical protein D4765_15675 [Subtercola vilae]|uniref:Uncharacterized protein n=1 Tax=Subtercola vilae TaxID=2056433 RepID=A0A4T2BMY9_9MICO|nr:hypothetical protein D4765_15675 [Subtercola vilae]